MLVKFFTICVVLDVSVSVPGYGAITVDISYGGALYAFVSADKFRLDVNKSKTRDLVDAATAVTQAVKSQVLRCLKQTYFIKSTC